MKKTKFFETFHLAERPCFLFRYTDTVILEDMQFIFFRGTGQSENAGKRILLTNFDYLKRRSNYA